MCAIANTSPRSDKLIPSEEKGFFRATMILKDGYTNG